MILDGSQRKWCVATLVLFLLATAGYIAYTLNSPGGPRGGSIVGMLYGIVGSVLMIFAGLISLRKKVPTWPIGSAQTWLRGHIWVGLLSVPLILFHAGFRWGGPLEQVLLLVMASVIVSGLIDLGVQQFFPRQMTARVPLETFYAQIPYECRLLQLEGDVAVSTICGPLPLEADESVATAGRLKLLGVTGRQPLPLVYRSADSENGHVTAETAAPHAGRPIAKAGSTSVPAEQTPAEKKPLSAAEKIAALRAAKAAPADKPPASEGSQGEAAEKPPAGKMTAAEKIAAMRAAKAATAGAGKSAPDEAAPAEAAENAPAAKLSAAEKIAMMRAAKKPAVAATTTADVPAQAESAEKPPAAKLSAAEKIAMMRAAKKPAAPVSADAGEHTPPAATAAETVIDHPSPPASTAEQDQAAEIKAPLSAADKIALMRSLKHASKPVAPETPAEPAGSAAASAATEPPVQGKLTAAEKIALMRAGKKPAADHPAPPDAAPPAAVTPPANTAAASDAKQPLSAADKIAMMRAKGKTASAPAEKKISDAAPAAAPPVPKKPVAAKKPAVEKPIDPAAQKRAAEGLEKFYLESVRPFLAHESRARGALASEVNAGGIFAVVGAGLPEDLRPVLDRLLGLCDKRRQLSVQERIHGALHFWLFIHVPLSLALLALGVAHAIMSVYY